MERSPIVAPPVYKPPPPASILPMPVPLPPPLPPVIQQPTVVGHASKMDGAPSDMASVTPPSFQTGLDSKINAPMSSLTPQSFQPETEPPDHFSSIFDKPKAPTKFTKSNILDATELTKIALKALEKKNGALAIERLRSALNCLEQG